MSIRVQYTTQLKAALGIGEEELAVASALSLSELLSLLAGKHGDAYRRYAIDESGALLPSLILCVNDSQVDADGSMMIENGSTVTFLSAISGG